MPAYIVATTVIHDPERFAAYSRAVAGLSETFGGEAMLRGEVREVLEGDAASSERIVVIRFPDAEAARRYIASPAYCEAREARAAAASVTMRLLID